MDDKLLSYYERELTFIRKMGAEFARKYPKIAGRLLLEPDKCEDPHTERLIEAFAFLSARVHKKIDDDFPEITESLLSILYPHYINPIPSMSIVKFEPLKQNVSEVGYSIKKNTSLYSKRVFGAPCIYTTCYPVTIWPVEVTSVRLQDPRKLISNASQAIVIQLKTFDNKSFSELGWEKLRFFLNGQYQHIFHLYELLFNNVSYLEIESNNQEWRVKEIPLKPENIKPVGFEHDEDLLPYSSRSYPGYRLLTEYFCFPEKFLFFDLHGLDKLKDHNLTDTLNIWIYLDSAVDPSILINKDTFSLNATPAVNLFKHIAEPIRIEPQKTQYHVIPDIRRQEATEIFSIDKVIASSPSLSKKPTAYNPFYSLWHYNDESESETRNVYWHMQRRQSEKQWDNGTEVFISFADLNFKTVNPDVEILTLYTTCTNRDLPARLPFGDPSGDFEIEIAAPVQSIKCLIKPTQSRRPSLGGALQWRLISHLSLNYLSLGSEGGAALKEILKLYDFDNSPSTRQQISGIVSVESCHVTKRIKESFCRGVEITIEFDEDMFVGAGVYLFSCILERFLGQYVGINSFSQLKVKTIQKRGVLKKWPPRNGNLVIL